MTRRYKKSQIREYIEAAKDHVQEIIDVSKFDDILYLEILRKEFDLAISERLVELYSSNTGNSPPDRCT